MANWGRTLKVDLINLAESLGLAINHSASVLDIKTVIESIDNYDKEAEYIKDLLETIKETRVKAEDREREEKLLAEERAEKRLAEERAEKRLADEREREEKRLAEENRRILAEKELENEFQLKKLQLELETTSRMTNTVPAANPKLEMRHLMQKFDPKDGDISLYLVLFERQAKRVGISEDLWVSHLIGLLPYEMSQLIARESEEFSNDYSHIKKLLLKRFKFSAEKFRQKFKFLMD